MIRIARARPLLVLRILAGVALLSARPAAALAQEAPAPAGSREVPVLQVRRSTSPIRIDGRLDEDVWTAAPAATGFVQGEPIEGAPAQHRTEVRVLYDEQALYVGARMYDDSPHAIARQLVRRDETGQFDFFELSLDPDLDLRTGYVFQISAAGVQGDAYLFDDVRDDRSWDAVWESAVQVDEQGWTAELRVPLSQIRYLPSPNPQDWGINFTRRRVASNERSYFSLESRQRHGRVSVFGRLSGLELAQGVSRLELRPYVLTRGRAGPAEDGDPFQQPRDANASAGLDARYGIGANFTLDATVNPDFGQVEVDPAVINLSAFETFYPERRPFFVEDARIFSFGLSGGQNSLFYSRRIGRRPQRSSLSGASYVDVAEQTSILGAMKLTGRTAGGLSVGVLGALTGREEGQAYFARGDSLARFIAEPRSQYAVFGAQQELRGGATVVGGMLSAGSANSLNCVVDADIDQRMRRTRRRPLPRHMVTTRSALVFGLVLGVLSTVWLGVLVNWLSAALALAANVFYVVGYSMILKRRTSQNIVWGGAAGCFPVLIGWTAVTGELASVRRDVDTVEHLEAARLLGFGPYSAALLPIIEEAGGVFTSWEGARTGLGGSAVATNRALAGEVRRLLAG